MTSTHYFIDISHNILNLWMRLIFPETRHSGLQFEHKNEIIPIRIELDMIFWNWFYKLLQQLRENRILACSSLPPIFPFSASLDTRLRFEPVCILRFCSFFFFFSRVLAKRGYCSCTVQWTVTANVDFSAANSASCTVHGPTNSTF